MTEQTQRAPTVFLSYASENREAARRLGAALPTYGLEVWYDESELGGGDAWDQKIRRQIRECDYFMPLVSAQTEARREGYFRREWRLAVERTLDMADDNLFLLPVVIDDTDTGRARVPEKFFSVQWLKVPDGSPTPALEALCRRLVAGEADRPARGPAHAVAAERSPASAPSAANPATEPEPRKRGRTAKASTPFQATPFPQRAVGQGSGPRFALEVLAWGFHNAWALFNRLPRLIRIGIIIYAVILIFSRGHSDRSAERAISPETERKLNEVATQYQKDPNMTLAKLGTLVAQQFGEAIKDNTVSVLALPFAAPPGDEAAAKLADATFAQTYTRISIAQHGHLVAGDPGVADCNLQTLLGRAQAQHTEYVLCGFVNPAGAAQVLSITLVDVKGGKSRWSGQYPLVGADPAKIAAAVAAQVPEADD